MEKKRNKCDAAIRQAIIDCLEKHLSNTDIQTAYPGILRAIKEWVWECELPTIDGKGTSTYQDVLDSLRTYFKDGFEEDRWWNSTHVLWALKNVLAVPSGDTGTNVGNADLISRQDAIDAARHAWAKGLEPTQFLEELPSAQPEPLTDKEQRIFLAAMSREEKVCKQVDEECRDCREPYEDSLVWTCYEITRKVKGALWDGK